MPSIVNYTFLLILPGALLSGLFVYFTLSYLLIPVKITLPLSIITSVLIYGLTKYYSVQKEENSEKSKAPMIEKSKFENKLHNIVFVVIYVVLLAVLMYSSSNASSGLFINWEKISSVHLLNLTAAILFSFFLPGYALVTILNKKYKLTSLLKLLLAFLFSILITGFGGYVNASFGYTISNTTLYFIGSYILIFLFYLQQINAFQRGFYRTAPDSFHLSLSKISKSLLNNYPQLIVFSSLFALVIFYTYYLDDGKIVVDEWYHHGRALLVGSALFKDLGVTDLYIPPFFPSLLAAFFNLSGSASVNAYVSISFLNIVPVVAFYYFFTKWIPKNKQRAALLASVLFMLSSGFGWLYLFNSAVDSHHQGTFNLSSSLDMITLASLKTFDIWTPNTFINVGHPDVTTALIIITLPAGFTLLGLMKEVELFNLTNSSDNTSARSRAKYFRILTCITVITAISFLGILSHDEFYLFIIVASIAMVLLFRTLSKNVNYSLFFVSFLLAISLVILVDLVISPAGFYTGSRFILGVPLIILCFLLVSASWAMYVVLRRFKFSKILNVYRNKKDISIESQQANSKKTITLSFLTDHQFRFLKLSLAIVIVALVAYFYLFTLLVWNTLSVSEISSQIKEFSNVPWYFYPIKFGLTGLLGLAFLLSYLFKKFETEIFIFGIIVIVAFFAGPYYDEHRFGKYIMASMAAFAALLIYKIISSNRIGLKLKLRPLIVGILLGMIITSSGLSIFFYAGWNELIKGKSEWTEGGRRDFPTTSEFRLLNFLNSKVIDSKAYNIALPEKETSNEQGFVTKIYGFSPTSREKLLQNPMTLNASTLEGLYNLLNETNVRYIVLPKSGIIADTQKEDITSSGNHTYNGNISNVMRFVLDNFPKAYEDQNYVILEVLPLTPPAQENSNVAFVYQNDFADLLPDVSNSSTTLPIDFGLSGSQIDNDTKNNSSYNNEIVTSAGKEENKNLSSTNSLILGDKVNKNNSKSITLWSHPIEEIHQGNALNSYANNQTNINFIEGNFRIIDDLPAQNKTEKRYADKFGAGIVWQRGNSTYLASVSDVGLQLSASPSKITLLTKEHPNETAIDEAIKIITTSANTAKSTQVITNANGILNLTPGAKANATLTAIGQTKNTTSNVTNNVSNITSNTSQTAIAEATKLIIADTKLSNTSGTIGTSINRTESAISAPSKISLLNGQPTLASNTNSLKQILAKLVLSQNEEVKRQKGVWYNLKILFLKDSVEIYLNDILRMRVPAKDYYKFSTDEKNITDSISRVGINSYYSKSEFQPLILGQIANVTDHSYQQYQNIYYQHYYPLNALALSKVKYDAFTDGDLSAFSKKYLVLPFDKEPYQRNDVSRYLGYVNNGGNLILINSDDKFNGIFSKLLSIKPGNMTKFTNIETNNSSKTSKQNNLTIYGMARNLEFYPNSNLTVKSYYVNKSSGNQSQNVAPFVIEKPYGKGKITYVNAIGYYDSIFAKTYSNGTNTVSNKTPDFVTLSQMAPFMGISNDNLYVNRKTPQITSPSMTRIIGDLRISEGQNIIINSSNLVFLDSSNRSKNPASYNLSTDDVSVSAGKPNQISLTKFKVHNNTITSQAIGTHNNYYLKKGFIKDLELYGGPFEIIINVTNSTRPLYLPTSSSSNNYIGMSIPKGFDMTIKFSDGNSTYAQLDMAKKNDKNSFQRIKVSGYNNGSDNYTGQILFHNVRSDVQAIRYISALLKSPQIKIINQDKSKEIENATDEETRALIFKKDSPDNTPTEIQKGIGDITLNIDHVDNYNEHYLNWTRTKFITYLKNDIQITDKNNKIVPPVKQQSLFVRLLSKTPGDISEYAKENGIKVPWRQVISSTPSVIISFILLAVGIIVLALTWYKVRKAKKIR